MANTTSSKEACSWSDNKKDKGFSRPDASAKIVYLQLRSSASRAMEKKPGLDSSEPVGGPDAPVATQISSYELPPTPAYNAVDKKGAQEPEITVVQTPDSASDDDKHDPDQIIVTGADAAVHLLPLRDDGDPSVTFRGIFLASCLSAFQAVMNQIYTVSHMKHLVRSQSDNP